ncbi:ParB/RepB/Spo0J family partition protein [Actinomadura macrotermitis]|nr:ParB N-terminal domain-containing protein [Actinomadura macrotermitis]
MSGESLEHVEMLAAAQAELPPITVHRPTMRVIDGMHRLRAALLLGHEKIAVRFFEGPEEDAFVLAVRANIAHGLPLSLADRKRAAERIIGSHAQWSDRMIAQVAGISARTVGEIRRTISVDAARERVGRDGKVRSLDGTRGRERAYELITEDPSLSLREIARAAGISPETARDVRNRLRRGEDPLPRGRALAARQGGQRDRAAGLAAPATPAATTAAGRTDAGGVATATRPVPQPAAAVEKLKADPALRFNESGRDLLRLLNMHTIRTEDWNKIVESVPPHCTWIVAQLARDCAELWTELASRFERNAAGAT